MKETLWEPEETRSSWEGDVAAGGDSVGRRRARRRRRQAERRLKLGLACFLLAVVLAVGAYRFFRPDPAPQEPTPAPPVNADVPTPPRQPDGAGTEEPPAGAEDPTPEDPVPEDPQPADPAPPEDPQPTDPPPDGAGDPDGEVEYVSIGDEDLDREVQKALNTIIEEGMTRREQARAIFDFARTGIAYTGDSDKSDWQAGAYDGLTKRRGDCFTYYAVSRAMLTALGIDNLEVQRVGGPTSHYWNLINCGDGWYHFDATPRSSKMPKFVSFMFTDEEAADYTRRAGRNYYTFDGSLYPERATGDAAEAEHPAAETEPADP